MAVSWTDSGILLSARKHGESHAVASVLTREHGRHAGLVRGGAGRGQGPALQPGNLLAVEWSARLEEQLGTYRCELVTAHAAAVIADPGRLAALEAACALADLALPEREPHPALHLTLLGLLGGLVEPGWQAAYVRWEMKLLTELGFGLDLSACAVTGVVDDLTHVSPRSGRAVSARAAAPYGTRLLRLPAFLMDEHVAADAEAVADGLRLTGHFLLRDLIIPGGQKEPPARQRLVDRLARAGS